MADKYNLYVGKGDLSDVDFSTPAETYAAGTGGTLVGYGFAASTKYTLVLRPETDAGLETPSISAIVEFVTDGAGEWTGLRPDPIYGLTAQVRPGGVIRLTWNHKIVTGATPTDFEINYGTTPEATGTAVTETYTGTTRYTKDISLSDGVTYWFSVVARASGLDSAPHRTLGITADSTAPDQPSITTGTTWQPQ